MIADSDAELEHVASQVMVDNPELESLMLIANESEKILFEMHNKDYSFEASSQLKTLGIQSMRNDYFESHYLSNEYLHIFVPLEIKLKHMNHEGLHSQHTLTNSDHSSIAVNLAANSDPSIKAMQIEAIGAILITFQQSVISNGVSPILLRVLPTSLIGIIMMLVLCYVLLHLQVLKPIGVIRKAMIKQQSGDQTARAVPHKTIEMNDMALSLNNMLDTIKDREEQIKSLAMIDSLTGLANHAKFHDQLIAALEDARQAGTYFAVAYIDLDRFKNVNDAHGHQVGDATLKSVARVLQQQSLPSDTVARLGGDEFALIAIGISQIDGIKERLVNIIERVANTRELKNYDTNIGASIGIAFYPRDATIADDLIAKADAALYRAKEGGRGAYCIYNP